MLEFILWIAAAASLATAVYCYIEKKRIEDIYKSGNYACKYNEQTGCYGTCCSLCSKGEECQRCCGADPKCCGGLVRED